MNTNGWRNNFRSPAAIRKNELISNKPSQAPQRNNISTARTSRRTRQERKEKVEENNLKSQIPKQIPNPLQRNSTIPSKEISHELYENPNELSYTIAAEMIETECPMPAPVPERFIQSTMDSQFTEFNNKTLDSNLRPDVEDLPSLEEETDCNFIEDNDSLVNKFPETIERQSITNSQVFSMSETDLRNFNIKNNISDYIEITNEEEYHTNYEELIIENQDDQY